MSKYIKSPAPKNINHVKHKKPRVRKPKNLEHATNIKKAGEMMEALGEEFFDDGSRRLKGYQHTQRRKITLPFISILGKDTKWNTTMIVWNKGTETFDMFATEMEKALKL